MLAAGNIVYCKALSANGPSVLKISWDLLINFPLQQLYLSLVSSLLSLSFYVVLSLVLVFEYFIVKALGSRS